MERRVVWHYADDDDALVAASDWASESYDEARLHAAGFEGVGRWAAGEPLEEALGLSSSDGYGYGVSHLDVEYLPGASVSGGNARPVTFRVEERADDYEDDDDA